MQTLQQSQALPSDALPGIDVTLPKQPEHGDFACNVAFKLSKPARRSPLEIAQLVVDAITDDEGLFDAVEVAKPGFINFRIRRHHWFELLHEIERQGADFARSDVGAGRRVLLEFVSANPTGPLHVGHGRGAVIGDVLGRVLRKGGYDVATEYYVNDVGNQIRILARSLFFRYRELLGEPSAFPENHYRGDYIIDSARRFLDTHGESYRDADPDALPEAFKAHIVGEVLDGIRQDLGDFGIHFDRWFCEHELYAVDEVGDVVRRLESKDLIYDDEGKKVFRTSAFGDEDDRVVIRDTGVPTYFASDIAYHHNKFKRGFETLINIWGADHHGYIPRVAASLKGLGYNADDLEILLVQFVNLVRGDVQVSMSTRSGQFIELRDVVGEVGADAARYFFLMRRPDSQMDFDLELAKKRSNENPVFYAQYGHARICTMLKRASDAGHVPAPYSRELADLLVLPEELELVKKFWEFRDLLASCARDRVVHPIPFFIAEMIKIFHGYFTRYKHTERVISDDLAKTGARLHLISAVRTVLGSALELLGVSAPDWMEPPQGEDET